MVTKTWVLGWNVVYAASRHIRSVLRMEGNNAG